MILKSYDENNVLRAKLDVHGQDIEEALVRLGWTALNDAEHLTKDDEKTVRGLQAKEYIQSRFEDTAKDAERARQWWDEHLVS
jgi:vacuolar-type H+-ATPase subunit C/Vma6